MQATSSLSGKKGLIVGIAIDQSIADGCARAMRALAGALCLTHMNDKASPFAEPPNAELDTQFARPLAVEQAAQMYSLCAASKPRWGQLDFALHAIADASAQDLLGRFVDSVAAGFARAIDISCHSLVRMAQLIETWMKHGGALITMSFDGTRAVVSNFGLMGRVKAALEAAVHHRAAELAPRGIRVHAVSPGPIRTRAASGAGNLEQLRGVGTQRAPEPQLFTIQAVGAVTALPCSDAARALTDKLVVVDGGYHVKG